MISSRNQASARVRHAGVRTPPRCQQNLNFAKNAILAAVGVVGIMNAPAMRAQSLAGGAARFEAASVKPSAEGGADVQGLGDVRMFPGGRLVAEKVLLRYFIQNAYGVKPFQLAGGPAWINSAHYNIEAKAEGNPNNGQMRLMMQALLAERFQLKVHHETRELPVYELTAAKSGLNLPEPKPGSCSSPDPNAPPGPPRPGEAMPCGRVLMTLTPSGAKMQGGAVTMAELVRVLSNALARTVVDKTGFTGTFDVRLEFTPDVSLGGLPWPPPGAAPASPDLHGTLFTAIQEQLGLRLESAKGPVDVVVIDAVERPSEN